MKFLTQSSDSPQIAIPIALFIHYLIYAAIYILQIFHPLKTVTIFARNTQKPLLDTVKKDLEEPIQHTHKPQEQEDNSFTGLFIKMYHQNTFFYTMCCIINTIAYSGISVIILAYIGLILNLGQAIGLFLSNEMICKITYCGCIGINFLMLILCIANY